MDGTNRPRTVCNLGQAAIKAGLLPASGGPIATLDADRNELMGLVADGLAANGLKIRPPECEGGCRLTIACHRARCTLAVTDWADVEWEWCPQASGEADAKLIADVATTLLTGHAQDYPRLGSGYGHDTVTFKGVVGLELKARGLAVGLEIYQDEDYFDASAVIVVTSPDSEADAAVHVADDGNITWTRDYWAEAAAAAWTPDSCGRIADLEKVAGAVVATITQAMSQLAMVAPASG